MTENEVFEHISNLAGDYKCFDERLTHEESLILCNLIEEIQQYRAIGTIEEFKALKEKSRAKKIRYEHYCGFRDAECPVCGKDIDDKDEYCSRCGQKLDWQ